MRILLVDDDQATRDVLEFTLTLDGHMVMQAENGAVGLEQARSWRPDLIVLDSMMPVMDGLTTVKHLRDDPTVSGIPILMLTAKAMQQDQWAGWRAGVDSYVTKPLDVNVLRDEIVRVCGLEVAR